MPLGTALRTLDQLTIPSGRPLPSQDHRTIYRQLSRFHRDATTQAAWARPGAQCFEFYEGNQWSPEDRAKLEEEGRPALTWNKIRPRVNLVLGYQRMNRYDIRYQPGNDGLSSSETAEALSAQARQISNDNRLPWREAEVFRNGIIGGRGYFDIRLDFSENLLGEVGIWSLDPFSVYPDSEAQHYEPQYWGHVTTAKWLSMADIGLIYGAKGLEEVWAVSRAGAGGSLPGYSGIDSEYEDDIAPERGFGQYRFFADFGAQTPYQIGVDAQTFTLSTEVDPYRKAVRVLDQQHYQLRRVRQFVDTATGAMRDIPDDWDNERISKVVAWAMMKGQNVQIIEQVKKRVRWTVTAADVILHDDWSPYDTFTIIPFFPYFRNGKTLGMVHDLIDPQKEINKRRSAEIHIVNTVAHSGWKFEEGTLDPDQEHLLEQYGSMPGINIKTRRGQLDKLQKIDPSPPPTAMERLELRAIEDLKDTSGVNDSALGIIDRVQSGKAIEARQKSAVVGIEPYLDNLALTRNLVAEKILNLIQRHYPEERLVKTMGDDGKPVLIVLNQRDTAGRIVNDVTVGEYDVCIDEAPASASFVAAQFQEALLLLERGVLPPQMADILVDLSSLPRKREIKARLAAMRALNAAMTGVPPEMAGVLPQTPSGAEANAGLTGQPMPGAPNMPFQPTPPTPRAGGM